MLLVERLSVVSLIKVIAAARSVDGSTRPAGVLFLDATRGGRVGGGVVSKLFGISIAEADYRLVHVRDERGHLISLRMLTKDAGDELQRILADPSFAHAFGELGARGRLLPFLLRELTEFDLLGPRRSAQLLPALLIVEIFRWMARERQYGGAMHLWLCTRPWARAVEQYAASRGVIVHWALPRAHWTAIGLYPLGPAILSALRWLQFLQRRLTARRTARLAPSDPKTPRVAVLHRGHPNLDRPDRYSDLMFVDGRSIQSSDLLVIDEPEGPRLTGDMYAALRRHGARALVVGGPAPSRDVPALPLPRPPSPVGSLRVGRAADLPPRERRWLEQQAWQYRRLCDQWRRVVEASNARVLLTWYKYSGAHMAMADGAGAADAAVALYQRAYEGVPSPMTAVSADIMFGWSDWTADVESRSGSCIPHFVVTGYIGDHRFPLIRKSAEAVRAQLAGHGARHIVAYFDENSHDDERWLLGHSITRTAYGTLLETVLRDPSVGLVLKPKHAATLRRRLGPVAPILERAMATGRCYLYEGGVGAAVPAEAALAADVAIHGHLHASTAAVEAALAGVPTIVMDFEGAPDHRVNALGVGTVVFHDWTSAWEACQSVWRSSGRSAVGRWDALLDELDPFRDGLAASRMASYLGLLLTAFRRGAYKDAALAEASDVYRQKWGRETVRVVAPAETIRAEVLPISLMTA